MSKDKNKTKGLTKKIKTKLKGGPGRKQKSPRHGTRKQ